VAASDARTARRRAEAPGSDLAGGSLLGPGPFEDDLHSTPKILWLAVLLMTVGSIVLGLAVAFLVRPNKDASWICLAVGLILGVVGAAVALANNIFGNVE
jgi:amino acid transporter